jgi:acyl-CoA thioester hydrolase
VSAATAHRVQTRWGDLDALGHVGHTAAFLYLEAGRDAFLRRHGIARDEYVVGRCAVTFRREIAPGLDEVTVECEAREIGDASITTAERILGSDGEVLVEAEFGIVLWNATERAPRPLTDDERAALAGEEPGG